MTTIDETKSSLTRRISVVAMVLSGLALVVMILLGFATGKPEYTFRSALPAAILALSYFQFKGVSPKG
jgi:hypothetical protein